MLPPVGAVGYCAHDRLLPESGGNGMDVPDSSVGDIISDTELPSGLQSVISPIIASVVLENAGQRAADFAAAVPAIVLCADLSGFSIAGATLARSEARGAEELRAIMNAVFGRVTDAIQSAGGQILQFSGDAVTAGFNHPGGRSADIQ